MKCRVISGMAVSGAACLMMSLGAYGAGDRGKCRGPWELPFPAGTDRAARTKTIEDEYPAKKPTRAEIRTHHAHGRPVVVENVKSREAADYYRSLGIELFSGSGEKFWRRPPSSIDEAMDEVRRLDVAAEEKWFSFKTAEEAGEYRAQLKKKMIEAIGGFPERTPLNPKTVKKYVRDGYRFEKVMFESQPGHHVTAYFFLPDPERFKAPYPAVLVPLGHADNGKERPGYFKGGVLAARCGMAAIVYDPIDQGERAQMPGNKNAFCVGGHVNAGMRSHLLGWNFSRFRIWDAVRAIDYLVSRPEVDAGRIGVMGQSGGGTLTSYIAALDPRLKASCPAGFVTTSRDLLEIWGPQDSEQNIPGAMKLGINHLSLMLMAAPMPVLLVLAEDDAFPIYGSRRTLQLMKKFYTLHGMGERAGFTMEPGRAHGWYDSSRNDSVRWLRRFLTGNDAPVPLVSDAEAMPPAGEDAFVTPGGRVMALPGERSVYDLLRDRLAELEAVRPALTRERVLEVTGIDPDATDLSPERLDLARNGYWSYVHSPADELAVICEWLGTSLVAGRAERYIAEAREYARVNGGRKPVLKAEGHMVIPAAHAWYLRRDLFAGIELSDPPLSWREAVEDPSAALKAQDLVFGALEYYDWPQLLEGASAR